MVLKLWSASEYPGGLIKAQKPHPEFFIQIWYVVYSHYTMH